jgi:signal transduction histidine kinase
VGLGLFVAQRIASRHGGTIRVRDSENLTGAAMIVTLPSNLPENHERE